MSPELPVKQRTTVYEKHRTTQVLVCVSSADSVETVFFKVKINQKTYFEDSGRNIFDWFQSKNIALKCSLKTTAEVKMSEFSQKIFSQKTLFGRFELVKKVFWLISVKKTLSWDPTVEDAGFYVTT